MESPSPLPPPVDADVISTVNPTTGDSNSTVEKHTKQNTTCTDIKNKRNDVNKSHIDVTAEPPQQSVNSGSSCASTSNVLHSRTKGVRVSNNRRNPRVFSGGLKRRNGGEADALALPLGMSIAAFVAQVLEKKDTTGEKMSADHLSEIVSAWGKQFKRFSFPYEENSSTSNLQEQATVGSDEENNVHRYPIYNELAVVHDSISGQNSQQLACVPPNRLHSGVSYSQSSALTTFERSVSEQARSNDLKALEISLSMKKIRLKEAQLAVDCDSNVLERFKLSMGISKANFRAEKFKTELQDLRHAQLLKRCVDCLVAGLLIMVACLAYGTYVHSYQRLVEANESCMLIKESSSWWTPKSVSSFSSGFQILWCQVQVISRMLFGIFMIIAITFLLVQRSGTMNQTMPVTFILLLLGAGCGFAGKFCIDTLGGSGAHWLFFWEILCLVHLFASLCTSMLFHILHGPVTVVDQSTIRMLFPDWLRRVVFYIALFLLPLLCGLMPFAGVGQWLKHFVSLVVGRVSE